eukprot:16437185-Heterocapsa_arctica.AAC.1
MACLFLAAGHCTKGNACPWKHGSGKGVDNAAAPSSTRPDKQDKDATRNMCNQCKKAGKWSFGADCAYIHDLAGRKPSGKKSDKIKTLAIKDKKKGKPDDTRKKTNTGAKAEVASSSDPDEEESEEE